MIPICFHQLLHGSRIATSCIKILTSTNLNGLFGSPILARVKEIWEVENDLLLFQGGKKECRENTGCLRETAVKYKSIFDTLYTAFLIGIFYSYIPAG